MPFYDYVANGEDGQVSGSIDSPSLEAAKQALLQQGLTPVELYETPAKAAATSPGEQKEIMQQETLSDPSSHLKKDSPKTESDKEPPPKESPSPSKPAESSPLFKEDNPPTQYYSLLDTVRLYAGWLLAWYAVVYALGHYQNDRILPWSIPYLNGLYFSPLVFSFALAAFLFLFATTLHRSLGGGKLLGAVLLLLSVGLFALYRLNT